MVRCVRVSSGMAWYREAASVASSFFSCIPNRLEVQLIL